MRNYAFQLQGSVGQKKDITNDNMQTEMIMETLMMS